MSLFLHYMPLFIHYMSLFLHYMPLFHHYIIISPLPVPGLWWPVMSSFCGNWRRPGGGTRTSCSISTRRTSYSSDGRRRDSHRSTDSTPTVTDGRELDEGAREAVRGNNYPLVRWCNGIYSRPLLGWRKQRSCEWHSSSINLSDVIMVDTALFIVIVRKIVVKLTKTEKLCMV